MNRGRGPDVPSGFRPTQLTGCQLWLRADLGITTVSGNVSAWADQSGNGDSNRNVTQGTVANRPVYNATDSGFNGKPTISFDATNDYLQSGTWSVAFAQPATWFAAYKGNADFSIGRSVFDGLASGNRHFLGNQNTTGFVNTYAGGAGVIAGSVNKAATKVYACTVLNGASSALYHDDFATAVVTGNPGTNSLLGLTVGSNFLLSATLGGELAELIGYSGSLSAASRALVLAYFVSRYG